eukprot:EG_transcript_12531
MSVRDAAMSTAQDLLPGELQALDRDQLQEVQAVCGSTGGTDCGDDAAGLWHAFAEHYAPLLLRPPGGCIPDLHDGMDPRMLESRLVLFWRCAVMLHRLPLVHLRGMLPKHQGLHVDLPPPEAPPWEHRRALVALTLPWFAQVAKTPGQIQEEEERKRKAEEEKKKQQQQKQEVPSAETRGASASEESAAPVPHSAQSDAQKGAADHTHDRGYQKWNEFDVDKALAEMEDAAAPDPQSSTITVDKDAIEEADLDAELKVKTEDLQRQYAGRICEAHRLKEEGNQHFRNGEAAEALAMYDAAVDDMLDIQENPLLSRDLRFTVEQVLLPLFTNRAAAELQLERWEAAAESATKALKLDPENVKALFRRGQAYVKLAEWERAEEDLISGLALKPLDGTLRAALSQLQVQRPVAEAAAVDPL